MSAPRAPHTRHGEWWAKTSDAEHLAAEHRRTGHDGHLTASCPLCVRNEDEFARSR